jgi:hypothetical protein
VFGIPRQDSLRRLKDTPTSLIHSLFRQTASVSSRPLKTKPSAFTLSIARERRSTYAMHNCTIDSINDRKQTNKIYLAVCGLEYMLKWTAVIIIEMLLKGWALDGICRTTYIAYHLLYLNSTFCYQYPCRLYVLTTTDIDLNLLDSLQVSV